MKLLAIMLLLFVSACQPASPPADAVPQDAFDIRPLMPGQMSPAFTATNAYGDPYLFSPHNLKRPALIIFYRGGWCPVCNLYWSELRKVEQQLVDLDMDVIFISADSAAVIAEAVADIDDAPEYHLLSDASTKIAESYGIAFRVDDETYERYLGHDINLEKASGFDHHQLPAPAAYIIGSDGIIKFAYVNPDYKVRLHPEVLLAAARLMPDYAVRRPDK